MILSRLYTKTFDAASAAALDTAIRTFVTTAGTDGLLKERRFIALEYHTGGAGFTAILVYTEG